MPVSPKDIKPLTASGSGIDATVSDSEELSDVKPSPPTVFTFTNAPLTTSEWPINNTFFKQTIVRSKFIYLID